jgi:hypothetical protein
MRGRWRVGAHELRHADQVDLRRSGNVAVAGTAPRPQIAGIANPPSAGQRACELDESTRDFPASAIMAEPTMDVGAGPWHVVPARAMIVMR